MKIKIKDEDKFFHWAKKTLEDQIETPFGFQEEGELVFTDYDRRVQIRVVLLKT